MHECGVSGCYRRSACPALCHSESSPLGLSVCECGAAGSASGQTACPVCPTLRQSWSPATRVLSAQVPVSTPPTGLDEYSFFISLVSDPLAVGFSVSSGCARRRSVSTYAAILVFSACMFLTCTLGIFSQQLRGLTTLKPLSWREHMQIKSLGKLQLFQPPAI